MLTLLAPLLTASLVLPEPPRTNRNLVPWRTGRAELASVGALTFGPDGVLFAADPRAAELYAFDTGKATKGSKEAPELLNARSAIAALLGTEANDVTIQDLAIHPATGTASACTAVPAPTRSP